MLSITELERWHFKSPKKLPPWASIIICHFTHKFSIWQHFESAMQALWRISRRQAITAKELLVSIWVCWKSLSTVATSISFWRRGGGKNTSGHDHMVKHIIHRYSSYGGCCSLHIHWNHFICGKPGQRHPHQVLQTLRVNLKLFPKQNTDVFDFFKIMYKYWNGMTHLIMWFHIVLHYVQIQPLKIATWSLTRPRGLLGRSLIVMIVSVYAIRLKWVNEELFTLNSLGGL